MSLFSITLILVIIIGAAVFFLKRTRKDVLPRKDVVQEGRRRLAARTARVARAIGFATVVLFTALLLGKDSFGIMPESAPGFDPYLAIVAVLVAVGLASCILSWGREWLAGLLLILVSLPLGVSFGVGQTSSAAIMWMALGLPWLFLVSGILLLGSWGLSGKKA